MQDLDPEQMKVFTMEGSANGREVSKVSYGTSCLLCGGVTVQAFVNINYKHDKF